MGFRGRVWTFGDDIDTDVIIPARYIAGQDAAEFGEHCMEGIDSQFSKKIAPGDIVVAGKNFGCGSSREPAPIALKAAGISCIIAKTFARIFYRNAFNVGLPILECDELSGQIKQGDEVEVNLDTGKILNISNGKCLQAKPIPGFMQELIRDGGLLSHLVKQLHTEIASAPRARSTDPC